VTARTAWAVLAALLLALLVVVRFETIDAQGTVRARTAVVVWGAVDRALANVEDGFPARSVHRAALGVTLTGMFVLLWSVLRVRDDSDAAGTHASVSRWELARARARLRAIVFPGDVPKTTTLACAAGMALIALAAAWQLGAFVIHAGGSTIPDTFASIDHPFHVARAEALRQSLLRGESLRWVANHQGGYPAEYYPFGFAYGVVTFWALLGGAIPLAVAYKLTVIAVLLAPGLVYWWMARRDGWSPLVPLAAFALHLAAPGGTWHGGANELVSMGLAPNVSSALLAVVFMIAALDTAFTGRARALAWAALAGAAALWCNPRGGVALTACAVGAWAVVVAARPTFHAARATALRLGMIAALVALLAAPVVVSLWRFRDLYHFVHYGSYESSFAYLTASVQAVSFVGVGLAVVGTVNALLTLQARPLTGAAVLVSSVYSVLTIVLTFVAGAARLMPQLETTRLMPFQRFLMLYLAAAGFCVLARWTMTRLAPARARRAELAMALVIASVGMAAGAFLPVPKRSGAPQIESQESAVRRVVDATSPDKAVLVVGSALSTHQQLWAPMVADRAFFYDNWMWYWHTRHAGPYHPFETAWYSPARIAEVFSRAYLAQHGIGAVIVADALRPEADATTHLRRIGDGTYTPYLVTDATPVATFGDVPADVTTISNHAIAVQSQNAAGDLLVRRNWFPRWRAMVNGRATAVERTESGYMRIPVPAGHAVVTIHYGLDAVDWTARLAAMGGLVLVIVLNMRTAGQQTPVPRRAAEPDAATRS
jgi:hypothetical protein